MSSKFGFRPQARPTPANGVMGPLDPNVVYAAPVHLLRAFTSNNEGNLTLTSKDVLGGLVLRDPNGASRTDTLPTAAALVAAFRGATVGSAVRLVVRNSSAAGDATSVTLAVGTGGTLSGPATIAGDDTGEFILLFTNTVPGSEAYTVFTVGTDHTSGPSS